MNHSITKIMWTETGHRLTNYEGKCAHLHGHSYRWEVTATCEELDERGMVFDFADLKAAMEETIGRLDHALILHDQDPLVLAGYELAEAFLATNGEKPRLFIMPYNPTAENMAQDMGEQICRLLPDDVYLEKVLVWETAKSFCEWRPV